MEKALEWSFAGYEGKAVICHYITYKHMDNVVKEFDTVEEGFTYLDENDMLEDFYLYEIHEDGFAYHPKL